MKKVHSVLLLCLALAACAQRDKGTPDGNGNVPNPTNACQSNADCDNEPSSCDTGTCNAGKCTYATTCGAGMTCNEQAGTCDSQQPTQPTGCQSDSECGTGNVCNAQHVCVAQPVNTGNGSISCNESGSNTNVTITGGILAHLTSTVSGTPDGTWTIAFGYGGTDSKPWTSDSASYPLSMPNTVVAFNIKLRGPGGAEYWFDVNDFNVSGTCAKGTNEFTHGSGGTTTPGNGTVTCSESGTQTTISVSSGILAHLFDSVSPNSNWTVECGYGCTGSTSWQGDSATHAFTAPSGFTNFSLVLREPGAGAKHWFDLNEYTASGTCSKGTNEFLHTPGGGTTTPGNGTISCTNVLNGQYVDVTFSNGLLSHLKKSDGSGNDADGTVFPDSSYWLRWGSDQAGWKVINDPLDPYTRSQVGWVNDSSSYVLRLPGNTGTFNAALFNPNGGSAYWLDLDEFNVTGDCSHPQGAGGITHSPSGTTVANGDIYCSESGSQTNVTISNGILNHLFVTGLNPNSNWTVRFDYGGTDVRTWNGDSASYTLSMPNSTSYLKLVLQDPFGTRYAFDLNEFNVGGTCSHSFNASDIFHTAVASTGNGSLYCYESGGQTQVTISNGIQAHLIGTSGVSSPSAVQFAFGGTGSQSWNGDGASYTFSMPGSITNFNFDLRDVNGNLYRFDVNEFNVTGTCSRGSNAFLHTATTTTANAGTIKCRLWDVDGVVKREVSVIPNANGILSGTFQSGSPLPSPEYLRLDITGEQQTWVGNVSTYYFYPATSVDDFSFFVADNNASDGGDFFNLDAWTITNETTQYGSSSCHRVGGGISIN